jgi:two-component system sensor histidine kinase ComP
MLKKNAILGLIIAAFIGLQAWYLYLMLTYPFYGIIVEKNDRGEWIVTAFDPGSERLPLDVQIGDKVIRVDDHEPGRHFTVRYGVIEQFRTLELMRNGTEVAVEIDDLPTIGNTDILSIAGEILSLVIAAIIYFKIPDSPSARLLSLVFLCVGVTFMGVGANARGDFFGKNLVVDGVFTVPILFLHFLTVFFKEKGNILFPAVPVKWLYLIPVSFTVLGLLTLVSPGIAEFNHNYAPALNSIPFFIGIALNFYVLAKAYFRHRKEKSYEATIIRTIWISLGVSFLPFTLLSMIPQMFWNNTDKYVDPLLTAWFILFFPASFAYLIASKQLYDIDFVMRRAAYAAVISLLPAVVMTGIVWVFDIEIAFGRLVLVFFLFMVVLTFVMYSLEYLGLKLEPVIFPRKHQLQLALRKIAKNLGSISNFRELETIILSDIVSLLELRGGAIAIRRGDAVETFGVGDIDADAVEDMIIREDADYPEFTRFEISRNEEHASYLVLTRKKTNTRLTKEEHQWLQLIVTYLGVSLENVDLIRKLTTRLQRLAAQFPDEKEAYDLNWFRKLMFELQERERVRIATDLHDTTMQDLFYLKRRFQDVLDKYALSKEDAAEIRQIVEYIEVINMNLRQNCFELHPYLLREIGLVKTLEKLVHLEQAESEFLIDYRCLDDSAIEALDMDAKRHLFRIVQELINNARKHSGAKSVIIRLYAEDEQIHLRYEDNGSGYDPAKVAPNDLSGEGVGLLQMKSRVWSMNGTFKLETGLGKGLKLHIAIPLESARNGEAAAVKEAMR